MARTGWLVLSGAVTGCAAVLAMDVMLDRSRPLSASAVGVLGADSAGGLEAAGPMPAPGAFEAGLAAAETVAASSDPFELERLIEQLAAGPGGIDRNAELNALLTRLAAIDARAAVRLAERLDLDAGLQAAVFRIYADRDPDAALAELERLMQPAMRRAVAVALLDVFGYDLEGIDRIAGAFAEVEALSFRVDALAHLAVRDPATAFAAADAFVSSSTETSAQQRIATMLAGSDPIAGIELGDTIGIALQRRRYLDRLFDGWAKLDPDGMLAYMETADLTDMPLSPVSFQALAAASPERLLALAEGFPPAQRASAQQSALNALTALDPRSAYEILGTLPPSDDRDRFVAEIATRYVAQDPDAALVWVTSLDPRPPAAFSAVLTGYAANDPVRAVDAIVAEILDPGAANRAEVANVANVLTPAMQAQSPEVARIAEMLATHRDPRVRGQLEALLTRWPQLDSAAATEWAMRDPANLSPPTAQRFALIVSTENPELARSSLDRMPDDLREPWIEGAASGLAREDFAATVNWLERFRGEAVYDRAMTVALSIGAAADPVAVARYLDEAPPALATPQVTSSLARRWAGSDPAAAERWVRELPGGTARDEALTGLLQAGDGSALGRLLPEYSSDEARTRGVMSSVSQLALRDPAAARRLVNEHISDPEQRAVVERQIEMMSSRGNFIVSPQGNPARTCGFTDPTSGTVLPC